MVVSHASELKSLNTKEVFQDIPLEKNLRRKDSSSPVPSCSAYTPMTEPCSLPNEHIFEKVQDILSNNQSLPDFDEQNDSDIEMIIGSSYSPPVVNFS